MRDCQGAGDPPQYRPELARRSGPSGDQKRPACFLCEPTSIARSPLFQFAYSYLLGMYLGDGSLSNHRRGVLRLRIALDRAYPIIIEECAAAVSLVMPNNSVLVFPCHKGAAEDVSCYSKHWACLLPR